jgi:hypothetical protein
MNTHPVTLSNSSDRKRSRMTVLFRMVMLVPHMLWIYIYSIGAGFCWGLGWIAAIFTGKVPSGFYNMLSGYVRYLVRVQAYAMYLTNDYPPFNGKDAYAVNLTLPAEPVKSSRLGILFRGLLIIPAGFVAFFLFIGLMFTNSLGFLACLFAGKMPKGFQNYGMKCVQFNARMQAYQMCLVSAYPKASYDPNAGGPGGPTDGTAAHIAA